MVCAASSGAAHTIYCQQPTDTTATRLQEIEVTATDPNKALGTRSSDGSLTFGAQALKSLHSFMGQDDPIRAMQSLPAVASNDIISGGIYVQGCENSHNYISLDEAQVYNPSHLFGLFSVFNTPHFQRFDINTDTHRASSPNYIGASIKGRTTDVVPSKISVEASAGIISTNATVRAPLSYEKSALALSARITYLNAIFGDKLRLGNSPVEYDFSDFNATYLHRFGEEWRLKISGYFGTDDMRLPDPNYASAFKFGWDNTALSISAIDGDRQSHTLSFSSYSNRFDISYSDIYRKLPSALCDYSYASTLTISDFSLYAAAHVRNINPQHAADAVGKSDISAEISLGADQHLRIHPKIGLVAGLKITSYTIKDFNKIYPLPSISATAKIADWAEISLNASLLAQFTHKIEESTMGLPTDYWMAADRTHKPLTAKCVSTTFAGNISDGKIAYSLTGYLRDIRHMTDWRGILFNMLSDSYDPAVDIISGKGRAWGVSAMTSVKFERMRCMASYNYGKSCIYQDDEHPGWRPTSHDRTHDLNLTVSWHPSSRISVCASWVYATGRPYTEPLYGYILGENLICEYAPLNSSRLPAMHRLDLSADFIIRATGKFRQGITASIYNAYGAENVLFQSFSYSPEKGFYKKSKKFDAIIPYISYYLKF